MRPPRIKTYINEGPGMFWKYQPGDRLVAGPDLDLGAATEGRDEETIAEMVYAIGNRMGLDANGKAWPRTVRSLSVGDVVVIGESAWAVAMAGFEQIERFALDVSLSEYAKPNERLAEHRLAARR
jgi:hypothetical protein